MDQRAFRKKVSSSLLHHDPEKLSDFQVNSRSSSFQEGVSDIDWFQAVSKIFNDLWKSRKGDLKRTENEYREHDRSLQKGPRDTRAKTRDASVLLGYLISSEYIVFISLFKYFIS